MFTLFTDMDLIYVQETSLQVARETNRLNNQTYVHDVFC